MVFANYVITLFGIYVLYYAACLIYDSFIKKDKGKEEEEEQVLNIGDEEAPQEVEDYPYVTQEKKKPIIENAFVQMDIETQGIPFDRLMADSKSLFATVKF